MSKDDLIRMAREAGFDEFNGLRDDDTTSIYYEAWPEQLERFFQSACAAGAAAERQAVLETIDALYNSQDPNPMYQEGYNHALDNMEEFVKARSK